MAETTTNHGARIPTMREAPTNAQQEPSYPGAGTVMCSLRYPDMTCHRPTDRCPIQEPHQIAECGEFALAMSPRALQSLTDHLARLNENQRGSIIISCQMADAILEQLRALAAATETVRVRGELRRADEFDPPGRA